MYTLPFLQKILIFQTYLGVWITKNISQAIDVFCFNENFIANDYVKMPIFTLSENHVQHLTKKKKSAL